MERSEGSSQEGNTDGWETVAGRNRKRVLALGLRIEWFAAFSVAKIEHGTEGQDPFRRDAWARRVVVSQNVPRSSIFGEREFRVGFVLLRSACNVVVRF